MTTLELQNALNLVLNASGYVPLDPDGKLGKKTCGAAKQFIPNAVPSECASKGYEAPVMKSAAPKAASSVIIAPSPEVVSSGMTDSAKWIIGSAVAVAVGLMFFVVAKKTELIGGSN
jgi:hypothetical protein